MVGANMLQPLIASEEWLLEELHAIGLGWGLAIVGLTLMVRMGTVPLTVRQVRSQRELQRHLPELKRLKRRHRDDKPRLQQETMAYYRRHGINPLAPFLPLLIQIPVFISLYYLMRTDVRSGLFGDAGFLFINRLTDQPHGAVAALLVMSYAASQLTTSAISTRTLEGGHRKLALALPLFFAGVVARFPAGLAVYWLTSSLWSLGQSIVLWRLAPAPAPVAAEPVAAERVASPPPRRTSRKRKASRKRHSGGKARRR